MLNVPLDHWPFSIGAKRFDAAAIYLHGDRGVETRRLEAEVEATCARE
jgi:hypothetical protein